MATCARLEHAAVAAQLTPVTAIREGRAYDVLGAAEAFIEDVQR